MEFLTFFLLLGGIFNFLPQVVKEHKFTNRQEEFYVPVNKFKDIRKSTCSEKSIFAYHNIWKYLGIHGFTPNRCEEKKTFPKVANSQTHKNFKNDKSIQLQRHPHISCQEYVAHQEICKYISIYGSEPNG